MKIKKKYITGFFIILPYIIILLVAGFLIGIYFSKQGKDTGENDKLFGEIVKIINGDIQTPAVVMPTPTDIPPSPTPIEHKVEIVDFPREFTEGGQATFTWTVNGPMYIIHKSTIYFGTIRTVGELNMEVSPPETNYTESVKDFMAGDFIIPMRFVGNSTITKAGKYYGRAYAFISGRNIWSEEREFTVKPIPVPGYEIKLINYSQKVKLNDNSVFTWEINGPKSTTGFTAIVGAKESKSGHLDESTDLSKTPYKILTKDFINGTYAIPLTYIGNTVMPEYGKYYVRALTVVDGKNLWTDEYTVSVE